MRYDCIGVDDGLPAPKHGRVTAPSHSAAQAARAYSQMFRSVYLNFHRRDAKRSELSSSSRGVLLHLAQSGPLTIGECAKHLNRTQSVVSEIVEQLVRHHWLTKLRDESDRRRTLVWLTEQGRERLVEDQEVLSGKLLERAMANMTTDERQWLVEGTQALLGAAARTVKLHSTTSKGRK